MTKCGWDGRISPSHWLSVFLLGVGYGHVGLMAGRIYLVIGLEDVHGVILISQGISSLNETLSHLTGKLGYLTTGDQSGLLGDFFFLFLFFQEGVSPLYPGWSEVV